METAPITEETAKRLADSLEHLAEGRIAARWLTESEAARYSKLSLGMIRKLRGEHRGINYIKIPSASGGTKGKVLYDKKTIDEYLEAYQVEVN